MTKLCLVKDIVIDKEAVEEEADMEVKVIKVMLVGVEVRESVVAVPEDKVATEMVLVIGVQKVDHAVCQQMLHTLASQELRWFFPYM